MKSLFILGVFLLLLVMMLLASCRPEPPCMDQLNFYEIPDCPYPIIGKDGDIIAAPPGEIIVVEGCIRPVSELLQEIDSLRNKLITCVNSKEFVYPGYIHPSGDYKWTNRGWQALRPFFKLSADSTKLIPIK